VLTLQDCVGLCGLSEEEVQVVAEHEHVPDIVAAELGNDLLHSAQGVSTLKSYMLDCIEHARRVGDANRAAALDAMYRRFDQMHPGPSN
jgi:hypothetical protein